MLSAIAKFLVYLIGESGGMKSGGGGVGEERVEGKGKVQTSMKSECTKK